MNADREIIIQVVHRLIEELDRLGTQGRNEPFDLGQRLAYLVALGEIKTDLICIDADLREYGLNFDIDARYA